MLELLELLLSLLDVGGIFSETGKKTYASCFRCRLFIALHHPIILTDRIFGCSFARTLAIERRAKSRLAASTVRTSVEQGPGFGMSCGFSNMAGRDLIEAARQTLIRPRQPWSVAGARAHLQSTGHPLLEGPMIRNPFIRSLKQTGSNPSIQQAAISITRAGEDRVKA
jgi:hypothetical protein